MSLRSNPLVLLQCCILPSETLFYEQIGQLCGLLAQRGLQPILVPTLQLPDDPRYQSFVMPFLMQHVGMREKLLKSFPVNELPVPLDYLLACEEAWMRRPYSDQEIKLFVTGLALWKELLDTLKPSLILRFHETGPASRFLQFAGAVLDIPSLIWERGPFPSTIYLDPHGAAGPRNLLSMEGPGDCEPEPGDAARYAKIKSHYGPGGHNKQRYYAASQQQETPELATIRAHPGKKILFVSSGDPGSNLSPPAIGGPSSSSPFYASSQDAFDHVASVVRERFPECLIILRPHPAWNHWTSGLPADQCISDGQSAIDALIEQADIVISVSSGVLYQAVLQEKSILLLGRCEMSRRDCCYVLRDPLELGALIDAALKKVNHQEMQRKAEKLLVDMFDRYLFGLADDTPTRNHLTEAADYLAAISDNGR